MDKLFDIIDFIVEFKKQFGVLLAIVGIYLVIASAQGIMEEAEKKEQIIDMWEEQLPAGHWMKDSLMGMPVSFIQSMGGIATTGFDMTTLTIGQSGDVGSIMEKVMEVEKSVWRGQYELKYADTGKKVRTIKLEPGESVNLEFYREDILQEFDITEKEFADKYTLLALHCVDDTGIATIRDGLLTAHSKGKTILYIYCDGRYWEYKIKVK